MDDIPTRTLAKKSSTIDQAVSTLLDNWQRHHLIPIKCIADPETRSFVVTMKEMGFNPTDLEHRS